MSYVISFLAGLFVAALAMHTPIGAMLTLIWQAIQRFGS
jgi:hypothetical protein